MPTVSTTFSKSEQKHRWNKSAWWKCNDGNRCDLNLKLWSSFRIYAFFENRVTQDTKRKMWKSPFRHHVFSQQIAHAACWQIPVQYVSRVVKEKWLGWGHVPSMCLVVGHLMADQEQALAPLLALLTMQHRCNIQVEKFTKCSSVLQSITNKTHTTFKICCFRLRQVAVSFIAHASLLICIHVPCFRIPVQFAFRK